MSSHQTSDTNVCITGAKGFPHGISRKGLKDWRWSCFFEMILSAQKTEFSWKKSILIFFTARPTSLQVSIFLRLESYVRMFFSDIFVEIMFVVPLLSIAQDTWTWLGSWRFQDFILRTRNLLPFPKASKFATQNWHQKSMEVEDCNRNSGDFQCIVSFFGLHCVFPTKIDYFPLPRWWKRGSSVLHRIGC